MEFGVFHEFPWREGEEEEAEAFARGFELVEAAERWGLDVLWLAELHFTPRSVLAAPLTIASAIAARTERLKIGTAVQVLPLGDPLRLAEETATVDQISRGRLIFGVGRSGFPRSYNAYGIPYAESRDRFAEALDIILKAWTEDGPFEWRGKHFDIPYVNPWPKPYQQPHPPIWLPGQGSMETIAEAARRRYPFIMVFAPLNFTKVNYDMYRRAAEEEGYEPSPEQLAFCVGTYVAETDKIAHREARDHIMWLFHRGLKIPDYHWFPPGYVTGKSLRGMLMGKAKYDIKDHVDLTYEELIDQQYVIVGSPDTVAEKLAVYTEELGAGIHVGAGMQVGDMPHWKVVKNMTLFAEEVMPSFRPPGNQPAWARGVPVPGSPESLRPAEPEPEPAPAA